jgi:hypothetical protein
MGVGQCKFCVRFDVIRAGKNLAFDTCYVVG